MKFRTLRLSLILPLAVLLSGISLLMPIMAHAANISADDIKAANGFSWVNRYVIKGTVGGQSFNFNWDYKASAGNPDDTFKIQGYGCTGDLHVTLPDGGSNPLSPAPTQAKLTMKFRDPNAVGTVPCQNIPGNSVNLTLDNPVGYSHFFAVSSDGSRITSLDGNAQWSFTQSKTNGFLYTRDAENGKICQDILETPQDKSSQYRIFELTADKTNSPAPGEIHASGCYNVSPNNSSAPVTDGIYYPLDTGTLSADNPIGSISPNAGGGTDSNVSPTLQCSAGYNPLNYILCAAVKGMVSIVNTLDKLINSQLSIGSDGNSDDPGQIFGYTSKKTGVYDSSSAQAAGSTPNAFYAAWQGMRNIALGLMVVAGLIVIVSQAFGTELVDAYTFKKILPRLLIAAFAITLSWQLMQFFVRLTNDLGYGVRFLIYKPFVDAHLQTVLTGGTGGNAAATILGFGALAALGIFGLLSFAATAALAVFLAFILLVLRQIVVIVLIIVAPIAIVAYILPNTQKIYTLWWESFSKALLVFPIIAAFIAAGRVFSIVAIQPHLDSAGNIVEPNAVSQFIAFAAYFAPYFLLPLAFKLAGGTLGRLAGAVNDRSRGGFDRLKNFRSNTQKRRATNAKQRVQTGNVFKKAPAGSLRSRMNTGIQSASLAGQAGLRPSRIGSNIRAARTTANLQHMQEASEKDAAYRTIKGNDDWLTAATHGRGTDSDARSYLQSRGQSGVELERGVSLIRQAKDSMGESTFAKAAAIDNAATGTGYAGGVGEMLETISRASGGDMAIAGTMLAAAKGKAEGARRYDLSGAGFGDMYNQMSTINAARSSGGTTASVESATEYLTDKALDVNGPGAMLGGRGRSVENMVPAMQRRVEQQMQEVSDAHEYMEAAQASGEPNMISVASQRLDTAERGRQQVLASTAGLLDVAAQVSPENARMLADGLLRFEVPNAVPNSGSKSIGQLIEANRTDKEFQEMRREYGSQAAATQNQGGPVPGAFVPPTPGAGPK